MKNTISVEFETIAEPTTPDETRPVTRDPALLTAARIAVEFDDGELIPMEWLRTSLDIDTPQLAKLKGMPNDEFDAAASRILRDHQFQWLERMDTLREDLLNTYQIALRNIRGRGYARIHPGQQTTEALSMYQRDMQKATGKAHNMVVHIRFNELVDEQKRENIEARAKLDALRKLHAQHILRKLQALPKEPANASAGDTSC